MNKTLKTIAWICIALGLLGLVVDAGALMYGRNIVRERQAAFEQMRSAAESGEVPAAGNRCIAEDANNDGKPDSDCLKLQQSGQPGSLGAGQPGAAQQGFGIRQGHGGMFRSNRPDFESGRFGGQGILLMFFLALGPILVIVGTVILLVNREPKAEMVKEEKEAKEIKKK